MSGDPEGPNDADMEHLRRSWEALSREDARWAVLSDPARRGGRWDEDEFRETGLAQVRVLLERLAADGIVLGRSRALDFGCGVARLTAPLAAHFRQVVGLDISRAMLLGAREVVTGLPGVQLVLSASPRLPLADDAFDLVLAHLVLVHMPPEAGRAYLREFVRVLRPGGHGIFTLPTAFRGREGMVFHREPIGPESGDLSMDTLAVPAAEVLRMLGELDVEVLVHDVGALGAGGTAGECGGYVFRVP